MTQSGQDGQETQKLDKVRKLLALAAGDGEEARTAAHKAARLIASEKIHLTTEAAVRGAVEQVLTGQLEQMQREREVLHGEVARYRVAYLSAASAIPEERIVYRERISTALLYTIWFLVPAVYFYLEHWAKKP